MSKITLLALCSGLLGTQLNAAVSLPVGDAASLSADAEGPAREALAAFREGSHAKAIEIAKPLAEKGDSTALFLMGYASETGQGLAASLEKALDFYTKAAALGNASAMVALGSRLLTGDEKIRNETEGREWLKKAIEKKEYTAYLALGDFEKVVKNDAKAALAAYESGGDAGQVDCMLRTADAYLEGKGTEKNADRGMAALESAAKAGSPVAHYRLAANRLQAEQPDFLLGYGHLVAAATGGVRNAQYDLALFYLAGKLTSQDMTAAVAWLTLAAHGGHAEAQCTLGVLYLEGRGVQKNLSNAVQLYSLAANQGHAGATLALAQLHGKGLGTTADLPTAWALATLADERGEKAAKAYADEINAELGDQQKAAAKIALEDIKSGKTELDPKVRPRSGGDKP